MSFFARKIHSVLAHTCALGKLIGDKRIAIEYPKWILASVEGKEWDSWLILKYFAHIGFVISCEGSADFPKIFELS